MKKIFLLLMFINIINSQSTRKELLETALVSDWEIKESSSNSISFITDRKAYEANISPLHYWVFTFDGTYQSSKIKKASKISKTKERYLAELYFKEAPRTKETRIINSYRGEDYCRCSDYFENSRVKVTKHPTWVEDKTAYYYKEYEVY